MPRRKRICEMSKRHLRRLASKNLTDDDVSSDVPEKLWKMHSGATVLTASDDYDKACQRLEHYLKSSESESSEAAESKRKRQEGKKRFNKFRKRATGSYNDYSSEENSDVDLTNIILGQDEINKPIEKKSTSFSLTTKRMESEEFQLGDSSSKKEISNKEFQKNLLHKLNKIALGQKRLAEQNSEILSKLSSAHNIQEAPHCITYSIKKMIPLKTLEELDALCLQITDEGEMNKLVQVLKSFGGKDLKQSCKVMLQKLIVDNLASKFSFQGRRSKPSFSHFLLNEAIRRSIRDRFPQAVDTEVDIQIASHLRYASQREKREVNSKPVIEASVQLQEN